MNGFICMYVAVIEIIFNRKQNIQNIFYSVGAKV